MALEEQIRPVISPKRIRIDGTLHDEEKQDWISALPDSLILEILSRLPSTKDAITTGILSKRWESLWRSTPTLIFKHYSSKYPTSRFVSLVDETLAQCHPSILKKFHVSFTYENQFESQVNSWIQYAVKGHVQELVLWLSTLKLEDMLQLQQNFFVSSCFTNITLGCCALKPNGAIRWEMLKTLYISQTYLDEGLIENILSGSPALETLKLGNCHGFSQLSITSKSVKKVVLAGYFDPKFHDLEYFVKIYAPNILSLEIACPLLLKKLLLLDVSSLLEAYLNYKMCANFPTSRKEAREEMLKELIQSLCHVKELKVGPLCSAALLRLEVKGFPFPSNMKFPPVYYSDSTSSEEGDLSDDDSSEGDLFDGDLSEEGDLSDGDPSEEEGFSNADPSEDGDLSNSDSSEEGNFRHDDSVDSLED